MSPYGAHDMAGHVGDWVADWYDANDYRFAPDRSPKGPARGSYHVLRGGAWFNDPNDVQTTTRGQGDKGERIGFRCARDAK